MQPVVHLAVGYLCYAAYTRWRSGQSPTETATLVALVGAALPDLIDKPLAAAGVVPVGRTIGHSVLFAIPLITLIWLLTTRVDQRELGIAFAIGYLSHLVTDVPWHVIAGDFDELGFLLWPVTHMPQYSGVKSLGTVAGVEITTLWLEAIIFAVGFGLWWSDGRPGISLLLSKVR